MTTLVDQLLQQAEDLAKADPKRPRQASVRRAISTAYYALFHFLIDEAARSLCSGGPLAAERRSIVARAFQHGTMRSAAQVIKPAYEAQQKDRAPNLPASISAVVTKQKLRVPKELADVAETFIDMQEARHTADYDLSARVSRADAIARVSAARDAIKVRWPKVVGDPWTELFFLMLLLHGSFTKR